MKFLPLDNREYATELDIAEVLSRLTENTESSKDITMKDILRIKDHEYFIGNIGSNSFKITRIVPNRNSFRPLIQGLVKERGNRTIVNLKMTLDPIVIAFMGLMLCIIMIAFLLFLFVSIGEGKLDFIVFIPPGLLLFLYCVVMLGFISESGPSRKYLEKLLELSNIKIDEND